MQIKRLKKIKAVRNDVEVKKALDAITEVPGETKAIYSNFLWRLQKTRYLRRNFRSHRKSIWQIQSCDKNNIGHL